MSIESRSKQYGGIFGDWHIEKKIGSGSNGKSAVFSLYRDNGGWREYSALKVISLIEEEGHQETMPLFRQNEYSTAAHSQRKEAEQEVRLMDQIRGKTNIVDYLDHKCFEWSDENGFGTDLLIRMELLTDLRSQLKQGKIFTESEVIRIGRDICQALVICHGKNILHRDIKPENIFFNEDGDYKLGDFGISRILSNTSSALASTGIGTAAYSAPEQFHGSYDHRVDIYSLGLVLYELSNHNRLPFATSGYVTQGQIQKRLSGAPLPELTDCGEALWRVIRKACAYDARERYATASEMLRDLTELSGRAAAAAGVPVLGDPYATEYAKSAAEKADLYGTQYAGGGTGKPDFYGTQYAVGGTGKPDPYGTQYAKGGAAGDPYGTRAARARAEKRGTVPESGADTAERKPASRRKVMILGAAAVLLTVVCVLVLLLRHEHVWEEASCTAPRTCLECGETEGTALSHRWLAATCQQPATCTQCGATEGTVLPHEWQEATADTPRTCRNCGMTEGSTLIEPIMSQAEQYASERQYRKAIEILDQAWEEYGTQELRDAASQYRLDFCVYNTSLVVGGKYYTAKIDPNGYVELTGRFDEYNYADINWNNIVSIVFGDKHIMGLREDGYVMPCESAYADNAKPTQGSGYWEDVAAISAGDYHTVALLKNGGVVSTTGFGHFGETNVSELMSAAGSRRIVAISAGYDHTAALLEDGRVVACGDKEKRGYDNVYNGVCEVAGWHDIATIVSGTEFCAGLKTDGTVVVSGKHWDLSEWTDIVMLAAGDHHLVGLKEDGTVLTAFTPEKKLEHVQRSGCLNTDAWENIVYIAAGNMHTIGVDADGVIHCIGNNSYGQCEFDGTTISLGD